VERRAGAPSVVLARPCTHATLGLRGLRSLCIRTLHASYAMPCTRPPFSNPPLAAQPPICSRSVCTVHISQPSRHACVCPYCTHPQPLLPVFRVELLVHCSRKPRAGNHAYVQFLSAADTQRAMAKHGQKMGNTLVSIEVAGDRSSGASGACARGWAGQVAKLQLTRQCRRRTVCWRVLRVQPRASVPEAIPPTSVPHLPFPPSHARNTTHPLFTFFFACSARPAWAPHLPAWPVIRHHARGGGRVVCGRPCAQHPCRQLRVGGGGLDGCWPVGVVAGA